MPKRRTRKVTRKAPQLPEGGDSVELTNTEKREKLEVMLKDFDNEVEERIEMMCKAAQGKCAALATKYKLQILKIPPKIRNMKMIDFIALGGTVESVTKAMSENDDNSLQKKIEEITLGYKKETKKRTVLEPIPDSYNMDASTVKKPRRANVKNTQNCPPSTARTRKSVRQQFKTPAMRGGLRGQGFETPLVTPKFDPRLPMTPSTCRRAKRGEVLMSMAGSPIMEREDADIQIIVPTASGATMALTADSESDISLANMDAETIAKMKIIQEKLAHMLR